MPPTGGAREGSVATDSAHHQAQVRVQSASIVREALKDLIVAVTSSDAVQRNSAINNCFASQAAWEIRPGVIIHGAARIKHVLDAVNHLTLSSKPAHLLNPDIEWDDAAMTARIESLRSMRFIFFPFVELSMPVRTTIVMNVDSEPDAGRTPQTLSATRGASIDLDPGKKIDQPTESTFFVTKWQDEWPLMSPVDSKLAWPFNVYLWMFRAYLVPMALTLFVVWAQLLFAVEDRFRRAKNIGTRVATHCVDRIFYSPNEDYQAIEHRSPRSPPGKKHPTDGGVFATMNYYIHGPARIFKSSTQLLIESLNKFLPPQAQLPSPRVLEWFEQQHTQSLQRRQSIHEIRKRHSSETHPHSQATVKSASSPPDPHEQQIPHPTATNRASLPPAWQRDTFHGHSPAAGIHLPLSRSFDEASCVSDEAASQPDHKRARRGSEPVLPQDMGPASYSPNDAAETATVSSIASSLASSSRKGRSKKTVTFTSSGLVPLPAMDTGAGTSLSPATKTTHTSIDPYGIETTGGVGGRGGTSAMSSGSRSSLGSLPASISDPGTFQAPHETTRRLESRLLGDPIHLAGPLDLAHYPLDQSRTTRQGGMAARFGKVTQFGHREHRAQGGRFGEGSTLSHDSMLATHLAASDPSGDALQGQESDPGPSHDQDRHSISSSSSGRFRAKMKEKMSKWRSRHGRSM